VSAPWAEVSAFPAHLGIRLVAAEGGVARTELDQRPELTNRKGDLHGGVLATLMDHTASLALRSLRPDLLGVATISLTTQFMAPASGPVDCTARVLRAGRAIAWVEAQIAPRGAGDTLASCTGVFRLIRAQTP
jgi:uncharacterized protein (TIGR00369 family)